MEGSRSGRKVALSCVLALCFVAGSIAETSRDEKEDLEDAVRSLKGQVNALLERRQEDFRILEESMMRSLDKNVGLASVKSELERLRVDVEKIRGGPKQSLNEQKNDHLTVQWLSAAVSELRSEVAEMSASYNSSAEVQEKRELSVGLDLLRGDVASFRRDLEELRAEQQQTVVTLGQLKQDVEASIENGRKAVGMAVAAKSEMERIKSEMTSQVESLKKVSREVKWLRTSEEEASEEGRSGKKRRHRRVALIEQVAELERGARELRSEQSRLENVIRKVEKTMRTVASGRRAEKEARLSERVTRLEEAGRVNLRQMFNVTSRVTELNRLRVSMLQLLESIESLENKMDRNVPELQREISKMEFELGRTASVLSVVKQDQKSQRSALEKVERSVARLEERLDADRVLLASLPRNESSDGARDATQDARIAALENKMDAYIRDETSQEEEAEEEDEELPTTTDPVREESVFNRSTLPELIHSLRTVQKEYLNLVHQLPRDCGSVQGKSGIYAITPGDGPPLLVSCDMSTSDGGWTVVQRRIDGSQDFNRNWKEYAEGFGVPSGELWLGNEALHRLTSDNCSSLRIEITDIYGKKWLAEYHGFHVSDASDGYRIHVFGYSGNASDALDYQNKMEFSAIDSDRDISNTHCAQNYKGGWWFSHCQHANLNGRYNLGLTWFDRTRNEWIAVAFSEMKVRRRKNCET